MVPGGISFGAVSAVGGSFGTNGAKSTIEVLNLLLGQGNDNLVITGTLDPLTAVSVTATLALAPIADLFGGNVPVPGISLTRRPAAGSATATPSASR